MKLLEVDKTSITDELLKWIDKDPSGHFDKEILGIPTTQLLAIRDGEKTIMYIALQSPLVIGPFITNPNVDDQGNKIVSKHEIAVSLKETLIVSKVIAQSMGVGSILVFSEDESIHKFAQSIGMRQMPDTAFIKSTIPQV